jgi:hypothetical protein
MSTAIANYTPLLNSGERSDICWSDRYCISNYSGPSVPGYDCTAVIVTCDEARGFLHPTINLIRWYMLEKLCGRKAQHNNKTTFHRRIYSVTSKRREQRSNRITTHSVPTVLHVSVHDAVSMSSPTVTNFIQQSQHSSAGITNRTGLVAL